MRRASRSPRHGTYGVAHQCERPNWLLAERLAISTTNRGTLSETKTVVEFKLQFFVSEPPLATEKLGGVADRQACFGAGCKPAEPGPENGSETGPGRGDQRAQPGFGLIFAHQGLADQGGVRVRGGNALHVFGPGNAR